MQKIHLFIDMKQQILQAWTTHLFYFLNQRFTQICSQQTNKLLKILFSSFSWNNLNGWFDFFCNESVFVLKSGRFREMNESAAPQPSCYVQRGGA